MSRAIKFKKVIVAPDGVDATDLEEFRKYLRILPGCGFRVTRDGETVRVSGHVSIAGSTLNRLRDYMRKHRDFLYALLEDEAGQDWRARHSGEEIVHLFNIKPARNTKPNQVKCASHDAFHHESVPAEPTRYRAMEWRAITSVESYKQWIRDDGWLREDASPQSVHLHTRAVGSVYLYFASDDSTVELEDSDDMNFARAVAVYDWFVSAFPESSEVGIVRISFGAEGAPKIIDVSAWIMNEMERVMPPEGVYHYAGRTIEIRHTEVQDIDGDRSARTSVSCPSGFSGYPGEADRRRTWRQFTDIKAFISGHGEMRKLSELPEDQFVAAINLLDMTAATFGPGVAAAVIGIQLPHSRLAPTLIDLSREKLAALGVAPPELDMYTINGLDVLVLLSPEKPDQREAQP